VTAKLLRPEDMVLADKLALGIYADNGVGKTHFVTTIKDFPVMVANCNGEPGLKALLGHPNIWVMPVQNWTDLGEVFEIVSNYGISDKLKKRLADSIADDPARKEIVKKRLADPAFKEGREPFFGAVAIDTWTRMQALATAHVTGQPIPEIGDEVKFLEQAPKLPKGYDAWQQVGALTGEWMRYFIRLNLHKIYLFQLQDRHPKFEGDGEVVTGPALTPTALYTAKEILEILGYLYVLLEKEEGGIDLENRQPRTIDLDVEETRVLFIGKDPRYFAKGPSHILGRAIKNPTWNNIYSAIIRYSAMSAEEKE
jgi:hypothetical protein